MEITPVLLLRNILALFFSILSVIFFIKNIYYGYKFFDGFRVTKKAIKASTYYLLLFSVCFIMAFTIYFLPGKEELFIIITILGVLLLMYYVIGLLSITIIEKISKLVNKK